MSEKYRVCVYTEKNDTRLGLCEVLTDEDGATQCVAVASTEVFSTLQDLKQGLERMRAACELPALTITNSGELDAGFEETIEALIRSRSKPLD